MSLTQVLVLWIPEAIISIFVKKQFPEEDLPLKIQQNIGTYNFLIW
jgi:hypothetical protein